MPERSRSAPGLREYRRRRHPPAIRQQKRQRCRPKHNRVASDFTLYFYRQRIELDDLLADNQGLKPRVGEAIARAYRKACVEASVQTRLAEKRFPEAGPNSWDDVVSREFSR